MKTLLTIILALWSSLSAAAPPCAPFEDSEAWFALTVDYSLTSAAGPYLVWHCYRKTFADVDSAPLPSRHCIAAPWSAIDLRRLGDRADTIRNAADQIAAFHASYKRHVGNAASARCVEVMKGRP